MAGEPNETAPGIDTATESGPRVPGAIAAVEAGARTPAVDLLERLARACGRRLNISIDVA